MCGLVRVKLHTGDDIFGYLMRSRFRWYEMEWNTKTKNNRFCAASHDIFVENEMKLMKLRLRRRRRMIRRANCNHMQWNSIPFSLCGCVCRLPARPDSNRMRLWNVCKLKRFVNYRKLNTNEREWTRANGVETREWKFKWYAILQLPSLWLSRCTYVRVSVVCVWMCTMYSEPATSISLIKIQIE